MNKMAVENYIKKFIPKNPWILLWMAVLASEVFTLIVTSMLSLLFWGKISSEISMVAVITSLLVSLPVSYIVIYLVHKIRLANTQTLQLIEEIKKRNEVEKYLQESEERNKDIINLLPQSFFEANNEGRITYINQYFSDHFQYTSEDLDQGLNVFDLIVGAKEKNKIRKKLEFIAEGGKSTDNEHIVSKKNGELVPVNIYFSPVFHDYALEGMRGIIIDISDQKKREDDLIRIEKLESIGVLTGGLAHKFNNILSVIQGNISLALLKTKDNTFVSKYLSTAEQASEKAYELARQLHSFSNEGTPVIKLVDISRVIKESASFTYHGSNIDEENLLPKDLWPVYIDERQFITVFNNIFINAGQAMPQGGLVTIRGRNVTLDANNNLQLKPGKYVHISIKDIGIGIPQPHFKKIFDPFFTTKQKGSGLGLSTCFSIINKHKGYITVDSKLGVGTVFHLYLHASDEKIPIHDEILKKGFFIIGKKIMVMEDQEEIRSLTYNMLKELGCEVHLTRNGHETIELYQSAMNEGTPFDIIILDLIIPGSLGGEDTLRVLQAIDPDVNAVVSSGCSYDPVLVDYQHYGFNGVIQKPFNLQKLSTVLYGALRKKRLEKDLKTMSNGYQLNFRNSKFSG